MDASFSGLLKRLQLTHYPQSVKAFAAALDIEPARVYRAMRPGGTPFDIYSCLKVALVCGEDPLVVLRAGGKTKVADQLEALCRFRPMSTELAALFSAAQFLSADEVISVTNVVRHMTANRQPRRRRARATPAA
jgi:hypothetical protein